MWITILLAVLQAIPAIIKLIEEFRKRSQTLQPERRRGIVAALKGSLKRYRTHGDVTTLAKDVEAALKDLPKAV